VNPEKTDKQQDIKTPAYLKLLAINRLASGHTKISVRQKILDAK
jgi:hypothetical protein